MSLLVRSVSTLSQEFFMYFVLKKPFTFVHLSFQKIFIAIIVKQNLHSASTI